nr:unnamed protein product [Haemonchus contortus]
MAPGCTFLFDFELPPIQAASLELPILVKGCFFHFTQAVVRHRDVLSEGSLCREPCNWHLLPTGTNAAAASSRIPQSHRHSRCPTLL